MDAKIQYFHTLVPGEALRQFDFLSYDAKNKETQNVEYIIQGFAFYFPLQIRFKNKSDAPQNEKKRAV